MASADRLIEIFTEAKARPVGGERDHFLSEACRGDPALREQVLSLLQAHEGAGAFLNNTQVIPPVTLLTEKPGDRIGRYKLLQRIGEGGCGVVYMADQEEPVRRRVAFKVIKLGMDTKQVVARFEAERQALALMDHPNIAKVFDAGATDTGRPYFVMELVRGTKITDYCDQHHIPTAGRLDLFMQVCRAIQHAHQKGIIHRDIKPSNILVADHDGVPVPKVIDFGIAKATTDQRLTDKTLFTALEQFMGTPAYMSPEQAQLSGLDIDTRTDVYSLGVLLYEMLTGKTPFDAQELLRAGLDEMRRTIREKEPARPSTRLSTMLAADLNTTAKHRQTEAPKLIHLVRGDLDWIVMKALEKDRGRRYETANGLAMDIQRHLSNEPVTACPPSRLYEFQKTVQRHKFGFAAAAALIIVLGLGVLGSTLQAVRATRAEREQSRLRVQAESAERKARTEATKSEQVAVFLKDMLEGVGPSVARGRDTTMLREILDKTAERVGRDLPDQPETEAELRSTLGGTYLKLAEYAKAEAMQRETLRLRKLVFGETNPLVAACLNDLARVLINRGEAGRLAEAETTARQALAMHRNVAGRETAGVALSLYVLASALQRQGKLTEAEAAHREALAMRRSLFGDAHRDVASSLNNLALVLKSENKQNEAEAALREALATQRKLLRDDDPEVATSLSNLASLLRAQGKLAEAETLLRETLSIRRKTLSKEDPALASLLQSLAGILRTQSKLAEAEGLLRETVALRRHLPANEHEDLAVSLYELGRVLQQQSKPAEAETVYREVVAIRRRLLGNEHPNLAVSLHEVGKMLQQQGKPAEAETVHREALAIRKKLFGNENRSVSVSLFFVASALREQGSLAQAEILHREELAIRRRLFGNEHRDTADALKDLASVVEQQGKQAEAEALYREGLTITRKLSGNRPPWDWVHPLAEVLQAQGKMTEAEPLARETLAILETQLPDDWRTFNARSMLGGTLLGQKKYAEAEPLLLSAHEGMKQREDKMPAAGKARVRETIQRLVQLYESTAQSEKAAEWKRQSVESDQSEAGKRAAVPKP